MVCCQLSYIHRSVADIMTFDTVPVNDDVLSGLDYMSPMQTELLFFNNYI